MDRVAASTTDADNHPTDIDPDVHAEVDATDTILDGELARVGYRWASIRI